MTIPVIFDCDNTMGLPGKEIDDGLTLLYLLGRPDIELLGVTTTFGNGPVEAVYPATQRLLRAVGREGIPVLRGAGRRAQPPTEAARFLADTVAARPGEIALLATGPLGNLRAAAALDPGFFDNVRRIACMGGYLHPLRIGKRDVAELNFSCDPEGAHAALHAPCPVTVMNAHVCLQAPFDAGDLPRLDGWDEITRGIVQSWLTAFGAWCAVTEFYLWDLLPAVALSHPELFERRPVRLRSTVTDLETGSLALAEGGAGSRLDMPARITDPERFKALLFEAWSRVSPRGKDLAP